MPLKILVTVHVLWWMLLCVVYLPFSSKWEYLGFVPDWSWTRAMVAATAISTACLASAGTVSLGALCFHIALSGVLAPNLVLYSWGSASVDSLCNTLLAVLSLRVGLKALSRCRSWPHKVIPQKVVGIALLLCSGVVAIASVVSFGLQRFNLDLSRTYEFRELVKEESGLLWGYLWPICGRVMLPVALVIGLAGRRWVMAASACGLMVVFMGITSHKSMALGALSGIIYWVAMRPRLVFPICGLTAVGVCAVCFYGFLAETGTLADFVSSIVYRRCIMVPALLNSVYVDLFSNGEAPRLWSESRLGQLLGFPLPETPVPLLIGQIRDTGQATWANTGWVGAGYAQANEAGVVIYSLFIAIYARMLELLALRHGSAFVAAVGAIPILFMMTTSDVLTSLGSGGGVFLLIVLWITAASSSTGRPVHLGRSCGKVRAGRTSA
jgi:hypothetical protein